jgi:uncharacterized membrane protein
MWTRQELKKNAWNGLRINYWKAFLVTLILAFLSGGLKGGFSFRLNSGSFDFSKIFRNSDSGFITSFQNYFTPAIIAGAIVVGIFIASLAIVFGAAFSIFVVSPFEVGEARFFLDARGHVGDLNNIIYGFKNGRYLKIVKAMAWRILFQFLWTLLFIIPGIVKLYAYCMVPYILADNPQIGYKRALELSMAMTNGEKFNIFVLDLSFIGWYLLGLMACCIGTVFVNPYYFATKAELYVALRQKALTNGSCSFEELNIISLLKK